MTFNFSAEVMVGICDNIEFWLNGDYYIDMQQSILDKLTVVFHNVFNNEAIRLFYETTAEDIIEWDSLNHVGLIISIEQAFSIRFENTEVAAFRNVGEMVASIEKRVNS